MDIYAIKDILRKDLPNLKRQYHIKNIGVFGSYVKGHQTRSSDIDILVEFEKGYKDFFNYMRLKMHLEEMFSTEVDLVLKEAVRQRLKDRIFGEVVYV